MRLGVQARGKSKERQSLYQGELAARWERQASGSGLNRKAKGYMDWVVEAGMA